VALSKAEVGCFIGDYFVGALVYADDIVLLALSLCSPFAINMPMILVFLLMPVNHNV